MQRRIHSTIGGLMLAIALAACAQPAAKAEPKADAVTVEEIAGTKLKRLALSEHAALRLGVATTPVVASPAGGNNRTAIPYSALIYDSSGATWTYTSAEPRIFVRHEVTVSEIEADLAILTAGPAIGTLVVTVGAAELWGVETGVGGGH